MKLPRSEYAIVDSAKLYDYCLSETHPRGRHKARVFESVLGMMRRDAEALRDILLRAAIQEDAVLGTSDEYGARYIIDFELNWTGRSARIRSSWIVRTGEQTPRFVTCFLL